MAHDLGVVAALLRGALVLLALPLLALAQIVAWRSRPGAGDAGGGEARRPAWLGTGAALLGALLVFGLTEDYAALYPHRQVLRDHEATVIATEAHGRCPH